MLRYFATTSKGLEALCAEELRACGAVSVEIARGGCAFEGVLDSDGAGSDLEVAYRACLWSRVASRVLLPVASFAAPDEKALYEGVRGVKWSEHIGPGATLAVDFVSTRSQITHTHFGALRTKDAIVDQLREERGERPSVAKEQPDVRINVHLSGDVAQVAIDLSGDSLHRRGWRESGADAPLKENLAAALLLLAGWPALARASAPLIDPMCGSGTLLIEAAHIAADRAPGLSRGYFGFLGWKGHDAALWTRLVVEARAREITDPHKLPRIVGYDERIEAVRAALANIESAGLRGRVHVERRSLVDAQPPPVDAHASEAATTTGAEAPPLGLFITNPPYGERLGDEVALLPLYRQIGDVLRTRFMGFHAAILAGNPKLAGHIGLRASRRHVLWNGPIECRLLEIPIARAAPVKSEGPRWRIEAEKPTAGAVSFQNRVEKNLKHLRKWAKREGITCFRVYDADLPEYAVAVDLYEGAAHVQEYEPPQTIDPARAEARLRDVKLVLPAALGIPAEEVYIKVRRRQKEGAQYEKLDASGALREVSEGGHRFLANFTDYLDTGLFLDHRNIRRMIGEKSQGKRFLNLFCYTGAATIYAKGGGARSTLSVDMSNTYLDWAAKNFELNGMRAPEHRLYRADCLEWLSEERGARSPGQWDLIFIAPPTFSRSKRMERTFDVQRDHVALLTDALALLSPGGEIIFSNFLRRFVMDEAGLPGATVETLTPGSIPPDFGRDARIHHAYRLRHRP